MELSREMFASPEVFDQHPCAICLQMVYDPVTDTCPKHPHDFCRLCLEGWRNMRDSCPISKLPFSGPVEANVTLCQNLMELKIKCQHFDKSCEWSGTLRDLEKHLQNCDFMLRTMTTKTVKARGAKGSEVKDDSNLLYVHSSRVELSKIKMEFSRVVKCYRGSVQFDSLSSIQLFYRRKVNGVWVEYAGKRIGGVMRDADPGNIDMEYTLELPEGEKLTKIILHHGREFFASIGFCSNLRPQEQKFGYHQLEEGSETIEVPEGYDTIGGFGFCGWVVDTLGFTFCRFPEK